MSFVDSEPQLPLLKEYTRSLFLIVTPQLGSPRSFLATALTHPRPSMELAAVCSEAEGRNNSPEASLTIWLYSLPVVLKDWIDLAGMFPNARTIIIVL